MRLPTWLSRLLAVVFLALVGFDCSVHRGAHKTSREAGPQSEATRSRTDLVRSQPLMGTTFRIEARTRRTDRGSAAIDAAFQEVDRVEQLISSWEPTSELSEVNRRAGRRPVEVGPELLELTRKAVRLSRQTDGAFDITFASCGSLWSFRDERIPEDDQLRRCREKVGYRQIEVDPEASTVYLADESTEIDVGGIGKGYGVDRAAKILRKRGLDTYMVDGGGDVRLQTAEDARPWRVGIAHPRKRGRLLGQLRVREGAVVTTGDYERYFRRDDTLYHHVLDPKTARPARKSIATTVLADRAAEADALATGLFVLGPDQGIALAERLSGVEALIVAPGVEPHMTPGFESRFIPATKPTP